MRSRPSACATTLPISVLPTPASPSRNSGRFIASDRKSEVARLRSATYSPEASRAWVSSIDFGNGLATKECILEGRMRRRDLLGLLGLSPLLARAQPRRVHRVGVLETVALGANLENFEGFRKGLEERGYIEGPSLVILYRSAEGRIERFAELGADRVRKKAALILTRGTPARLAARRASAAIPIVMAAVADPVESGL